MGDEGELDWLDGLTDHPSAKSWSPGAAGLVLHTILADPARPDRLWVGISAAGVFASEDGGRTWERRNRLSSAPRDQWRARTIVTRQVSQSLSLGAGYMLIYNPRGFRTDRINHVPQLYVTKRF